jgi:WD40 repeat protein
VKFAAWGNNLDRFYTGSSDGVLKAWNIRSPPGRELVRDVVRLSGGISAGKFSPDFSKLVIGDSTGKVHLLSLGQAEPSEAIPIALRKPITPHPPLPAPLIDDDDMEIPPEQTAKEIGQEFLDRGQITIHEDEWIGAVQGPNYASTGLFYNVEEYKDELVQVSEGWSTKELREKQLLRYNVEMIEFPRLPDIQSSNLLLHEKNVNLDLNLAALSPETYVQLREERVDINFQSENDFLLELGPILDVEDIDNNLSTQGQLLGKLFLTIKAKLEHFTNKYYRRL